MKIGLTGGIATGKSSVAAILKELGARVIDGDKLARGLMSKGQLLWQRVVEEFGEVILAYNGEIDRKVLGEIIFSDPNSRMRLDDITHPVIVVKIKEEVEELEGEAEVVVAEVPLLFEVGMQGFFDQLLVVWSEEELQARRLMNRDSLGYNGAMARINSQMQLKEKVELADYAIENNGDENNLRKKVIEYWSRK